MIKIEPDYRTVVELEDEWNRNISDMFELAVQGRLKIWRADNLRLRQVSEPISKEEAKEIFRKLTLEGTALFEELEEGFEPQLFDSDTGENYAIKNTEITRFEQKYKKPETKEERKARLAKRQKEKREAAAMKEIEFYETFCTDLFHLGKTSEVQPKPKKKETIQTGTLTLEMPPANHPCHSRELSAAIHCWNALYKDRPEDVPKPKNGYIIEIKKWLEQTYSDRQKLSKNKISLIARLLNPDPRGSPPPSKSQAYPANPDASKTLIEIREGHHFTSEKLIAAIRCWNHFYKGNTAPAPLTRQDPQKEKILEWLEGNYPNLAETAKKDIIKVVNPNPTGR